MGARTRQESMQRKQQGTRQERTQEYVNALQKKLWKDCSKKVCKEVPTMQLGTRKESMRDIQQQTRKKGKTKGSEQLSEKVCKKSTMGLRKKVCRYCTN